METQTIIDISREAIWYLFLLGAPVLLTGLAFGLIVGLMQALTQIQDQTVAFVPKLIGMLAVFAVTLPWIISKAAQYSAELISSIPSRF